MDISNVSECHLLPQMTSQSRSQKLLQGFLSHALSVYLSVFDLVLTHSNDCVIKRMKPDSFVSHNFLKFSFTNSQGLWSNLLSVNVSLNQTLLNLFWPFFWERLSSYNPKRFCYSYAWSCCLCEGKTSFSIGPYLLKTLQILICVVAWLYVIRCLTPLFSIFIFLHSFWCYFI